MAELLQFVFSGLTVGAIYALVALGFTLIYKSSDIINFAQGEFVMLGGMVTVFAALAGMPLAVAAAVSIVATTAVGLALHRLAVAPARGATPVALIMITIGASIFLRGVAQTVRSVLVASDGYCATSRGQVADGHASTTLSSTAVAVAG